MAHAMALSISHYASFRQMCDCLRQIRNLFKHVDGRASLCHFIFIFIEPTAKLQLNKRANEPALWWSKTKHKKVLGTFKWRKKRKLETIIIKKVHLAGTASFFFVHIRTGALIKSNVWHEKICTDESNEDRKNKSLHVNRVCMLEP